MVLEFDAPLLKWGNSYALRITRAQVEALGARPGVRLHAMVAPAESPDWQFPTFASGRPVAVDEMDDVLVDAAWEGHDGRRR